ncbi:tRNA dimethylallyltransferase [Buchnera aphidicola (Myzocallis carpini)]
MMQNNIFNKKYVIFLMGPTASGKSELSMQLQKYLPVELVSVDSALVYKGMDIGTAKPNKKQLLKHPLRLINLRDPKDYYCVQDFRCDVLQAIKEIFDMQKIPLLVGGTMFYYNILLHGISNLPKSNIDVRNTIFNKYGFQNSFILHQYLSKMDRESAENIHPNDLQRILRALEVCLITGKKYSILKKKVSNPFTYHAIQFAIYPEKKFLYDNINTRFYHMLNNGFELEVRTLFHRKDLNIDLPAMRCVGYRQMFLYFMKKMNFSQMIQSTIFATRQLVKKQRTWLKKWKNVYFLYDNKINYLTKKIISILYKIIPRNY